jgi:RecB family endonuclease NucS
LDAQFATSTVSTQLSGCKRVETAYGDLDEIFDNGALDDLIGQLAYSRSDETLGQSNPSKIQIERGLYDNLASCRTALRTYRNFRNDPMTVSVSAENAIEVAGELIRERKEGRQFEVERHLQAELRKEISQLENGLTIVDGGSERGVESGFIDILARDIDGALVVIELKVGQAKREALGQIAGYIGDLMNEEDGAPVRGILVAADFDKSCRSGVRAFPSLKLMRYRFDFAFEQV